MNSDLVYQLTLFLHILGAFGLVAALTLEAIGLRELGQSGRYGDAAPSRRAIQRAGPLGALSGGVILVSGLYMTHARWGVQGWILVSLAGLVLIALGGALLTRSRMARMTAAINRATDPLSMDVRRMLRDPVLTASLRARVAMLLGILFVMTIKPSTLAALTVISVAPILGLVSRGPKATLSDHQPAADERLDEQQKGA